MRVEQVAGRCAIEVFTEGSPLCSEISIECLNGEVLKARVSINELHDLRYCIERVLAQVTA